jgi:hypothetical protein
MVHHPVAFPVKCIFLHLHSFVCFVFFVVNQGFGEAAMVRNFGFSQNTKPSGWSRGYERGGRLMVWFRINPTKPVSRRGTEGAEIDPDALLCVPCASA